MQKHGGKGQETLLNTDTFMVELWQHLCRDFRTLTSYTNFREEELALEAGIKTYRAYDYKRGFLSPPTYFKCRYQLDNLFKRYRFSNDAYTDDELVASTFQKFLDVQSSRVYPSVLSTRTFLVLQKARAICRSILGKYSQTEHYEACRFGKRASVGTKYKNSYLDIKQKCLSCSREQGLWFKSYLEGDTLLSDAIREIQQSDIIELVQTSSLDYTLVPKSFKSLRGIMPNTTIGGFYTYGLGRCIRRALKDVGLNIKKLQVKHGRYAQRFSRTRTHVTADLSSASDCFTSALVNRLVPREWFNLLKKGRISTFQFKGNTFAMSSFMTMGIGFTFELQTLLFYSLLKAIACLSNIKGTISVYGDDLIYPSSMHPYVTQIFQDVGFKLNQEKTYVKEDFRESCGSDFYCGLDVRPFQPEGCGEMLSGVHAAVFLYKMANGLRRRWKDAEIASALNLIERQILRHQPHIYYVPLHYPDTSGWQTDKAPGNYFNTKARWYLNSNWTVAFPYITLTKKYRRVRHQCIYYWNSLRPSEDEWDPYLCIDDVSELIWRSPKGVPLITAGSLSSKEVKVRKMIPFVIKKGVLPHYRVAEGLF